MSYATLEALLIRARVRLRSTNHAINCHETVTEPTDPRTDRCNCGLLTLYADINKALEGSPLVRKQPDMRQGNHDNDRGEN